MSRWASEQRISDGVASRCLYLWRSRTTVLHLFGRFQFLVDRCEALRRNLNRSMLGAEIGPFYSPILPKADGWKTIVVDWASAASLREKARAHSAEAVRSRVDQIEEVDVVWDGKPIDEACLPVFGDKLDYVLASHMIEHTPDLISFLQQCSRLLKPEGIISLAVPDMRKCFDLLKTPTATREVLTAYRERRVRHTPETLFEARGYAVERGTAAAWVSGDVATLHFNASFAHTRSMYDQESGAPADAPYVDAHAWHFTPASFELVMLELNAMGLIDFTIDWIELSAGSEFITQLRRRPLALSEAELQERRMTLALRRYAELAAELPEPVWPVRERVVPADLSTLTTASLLGLAATRAHRKVMSRLGRGRSDRRSTLSSARPTAR